MKNKISYFDDLQETLLEYMIMLEYSEEYENDKEASDLINKINDAVFFNCIPPGYDSVKYFEKLLAETEDFIKNH